MATTKPALRTKLRSALQNLSTGELHGSATALFNELGYASHKTADLPSQPQDFVRAIEGLLGNSTQLHATNASLPDSKSATFLFQFTNDELPALAAGQLSLLADAGGVQAH